MASEWSRLRVAMLFALPLDILFWLAASQTLMRAPKPSLDAVTVERVVVDDKGRVAPKPPPPPPPKPKIPKVMPKMPPIPRQAPIRAQVPVPANQKKPDLGHSKVITATPNPANPNPPDTASAGGNASPGKPIAQQEPGSGKGSDVPATPAPPQPTPMPPTPTPAPPGPTPAPIPTPKPPPPPLPPPPKPTGPTQDAEPNNEVKPEIPEELKDQSFKSFVRVRVHVAADGSFSVELYVSSGNPEVDQRVLDALKKWKWKPALKDGEPVASVQRFKFEFLVQ